METRNAHFNGNQDHIATEKLGQIAIATSCLGMAGMLALNIYLHLVGVNGLWTGWPVYLYTLSKLVIPGLILVRLLYFLTYEIKYRLWSLALVIPILVQAFLNGRRAWTFLLIFAWFLPAVMVGRFRLRPLYGLAAIAIAFLVFTLFPAYRNYAHEDGYAAMWQEVQNRPPTEVLANFFSGEQTLELRDAVVLTGIVKEFKLHSFGVRILNRVIQHYVPGSLIGRELKESLKFATPQYSDYENKMQIKNEYAGGDVKFYTAKTGFFDSYAEFSIFGVALYFILGMVFRRAENLCFDQWDLRGVLFMCLLGFLPGAVAYDEWANVLTLYLPSTFIFLMCLRYAKPSNTNIHSVLNVNRAVPSILRQI